MPREVPKVREVWRHAPFFEGPVSSRPLSRAMVKSLSSIYKKTSGAKRAYAFPTGADSPEPLWVVTRGTEYDHKDLELAHVFPNGCMSVWVGEVPGTEMRLPTAWRIYIESGRHSAPLNQCIKNKFGVEWPGNIVMIKHRRRSDHIAQVPGPEEDFADVILALWLKEFIQVLIKGWREVLWQLYESPHLPNYVPVCKGRAT
ncbi:hypothetical protein C8J57DRAFT_1487631 [Mycena rebaudengoi]|nr:hypothetical protein C8J57DRAFT_1487631 [Mycena rebaudengoi]